jgi:hypothetical protein
MTNQGMRPRWAISVAVLAGLFGVLSLYSGGQVLFIDGVRREAAGNYMAFIVWFNFLAGFAYMAGAAGLVLWRTWIKPLAFAIALLTIVAFIVFGIFILMGDAYEVRTVGAMSLRSLLWLGIAFAVRRTFAEKILAP